MYTQIRILPLWSIFCSIFLLVSICQRGLFYGLQLLEQIYTINIYERKKYHCAIIAPYQTKKKNNNPPNIFLYI